MAPTPRKRPSPVSIRLTIEQQTELKRRAGSENLSGYIKAALFDGRPMRGARGPAGPDRVILARILAQLGSSELSTNLSRLAEAAASGSLVADEITTSHLREACESVRDMRDQLRAALRGRITPDEPPRPPVPTRLDELFNSLNAQWGGKE